MPVMVNHIGVTVPDVFAAITWYREVFGFDCVVEPRVLGVDRADPPPGLDSRFREGRISCLMAGNGVGIELFQFVEPQTEPERPTAYAQRGPWHLCFTVPDVPALTATVVEQGGRLLTVPKKLFPGRPHVLSYVTDPWGTVIELMSHDPAEVFAQWPSDKAFPIALAPNSPNTAPHEGARS